MDAIRMANPKTNLKNLELETTLPKITISFIKLLAETYPEVIFKCGKRFAYHPKNTVIIGPAEPNFALLALHELGHALSHHQDYKVDIDRLKIESEAWQAAKRQIENHPEWSDYGIAYDEDFAEEQLDTYRNWLHQKSLCKKCGLTRIETPDGKYHCPNCDLMS